MHAERASLLVGLGRVDDAIAEYQHALNLAPDDQSARNNLGLLYLQHKGKPALAELCFRAVLSMYPNQLEALANLGLALHDQGRVNDELALYQSGLSVQPDDVEIRWNRGLANLSLRNFDAGWPDYQLRFARRGGRNFDRFDFPNWDGASLPQSRLLVLAEQGLGDEIMFSSCLPDLCARAKAVVLECAPRLFTLFARSFPRIAVHGRERHAPLDWLATYPDIAAKVPAGSLPTFLRRDESAFPRIPGYLRADAEGIAACRAKLRDSQKRMTVGLSWRGGSLATRSALRSIELSAFRGLTDVIGIEFVALQHDMTDAERALAAVMRVTIFGGLTSDIDGLATMIAALDLVISVDNTVLHLAGALGVPVWGLLGVSPEWRFACSGRSIPWYPSVQVFRAADYGGWDAMLVAVAQQLSATTGEAACLPNRTITK